LPAFTFCQSCHQGVFKRTSKPSRYLFLVKYNLVSFDLAGLAWGRYKSLSSTFRYLFKNVNARAELSRPRTKTGYSLVELILVIIIIGIITSVAVRSLRTTHDTARVEQTKKELDQLAWAIAGNPVFISGGTRTDFGYVGDVGAMPPNLDALVSNPGYATWDGPYIRDDFYLSGDSSEVEFKFDAWGTAYTYSGGTTISSTGGSSTITREIAGSLDDLLRNTVSAVIVDLDNTPPGSTYRDSVRILFSYPNGGGSITTKTEYPGSDGFVRFDSIPIGNHQMQVVYIPSGDTLTRIVSIEPGQDSYTTVSLPEDLW
jgi:prepilin-type N-terminal cleavage/methylation domain-containing protein